MKNKNIYSKLSIFCLVLLLSFCLASSNILSVLAYSTETFQADPDFFNNAITTQNINALSTTHQSGRILVVEIGYNFGASCVLKLRIFGSSGAFENNVSLAYNFGANWINGLTVAVQNYDADECLVWSVSRYAAAAYQWRMTVQKVNVITGAYTTYNVDVAAGAANYRVATMQTFVRGTEYFCVIETSNQASINNFIRIAKFNGAGVTWFGSLDLGFQLADPFGVRCWQYQNDTSQLFIVSDSVSANQPALYTADLTSGIILYQITCGTVYLSTNQATRMNWHLIDGGCRLDSGNYYIYLTWVYGYLAATVRYSRFVQWRIQFSTIPFAPATILGQNARAQTYTTSWGAHADVSSVTGYKVNDGIQYKMLWTDYQAGTNVVSEALMSIPDWFNMGSSDVTINSYIEDSNEVVPYDVEESLISRNFAYTYQLSVNLVSVPDVVYLYFQLSATGYNFDVTLTHTPNDSPLINVKPYVFNGQVNNNGIGYYCVRRTLIDGIQYAYTNTNPTGAFSFGYSFSNTGSHTIRIEVYTAGILRYGEDFVYSVTDAPPPTSSPYVGNVYVTLSEFMRYMPLMSIIIIPSILAYAESKSVYLSLMVMVVAIGVLVALALLPYFIFFLAIFGFIGYVLLARRTGGD